MRGYVLYVYNFAANLLAYEIFLSQYGVLIAHVYCIKIDVSHVRRKKKKYLAGCPPIHCVQSY